MLITFEIFYLKSWECSRLISWVMPSRTILNVPRSAIGGATHLKFCHKMQYFTNAMAYRYEPWYGSSWPYFESSNKDKDIHLHNVMLFTLVYLLAQAECFDIKLVIFHHIFCEPCWNKIKSIIFWTPTKFVRFAQNFVHSSY